ncbi:MAG: protein kinase [Phycisphaerales bacterium]|nr:protein kinase [Phycisphaerales bacterium]
MPNEASTESTPESEIRSSVADIQLARAQIDAAQVRQQKLRASGKLAAASVEVAPMKALPGYTLMRELHRGGQGVVYLGVQQSTGRQVAIKLLHRELPTGSGGSGSGGLARFEREIEILSRLKHPNIVTVHDCGRDRGHVFLVMDYVIGRPLDVWAARFQFPSPSGRGGRGEGSSTRDDSSATPSPQPSPKGRGSGTSNLLDVLAKICDGVNAAHLRGVIHRDLKPGNILVDERGEPHVLDFGLAKLVEDSEHVSSEFAAAMTVTGQFVGSLPWASPEQAEGRTDAGALDIRTDVYSLGVILYQVLTGRFPYPVSGRLSDVVRNIVESDPVRPSTIESGIDRELETIVLKCLCKEPERRYQSAGDLARDIRRYMAGEAIEARRDSLAYVMSKRLARYRVAAITGTAMLLVVVGALIVSIAFGRQAAHQAVLAQQSADRADDEAAQARAVTDFMREVLTSVEPENQGADVRLIEVLEKASSQASQRFAGHPQQEGEVRDMLGQVYDKLSMWRDARDEHARAAELWRQIAGPDDPRALASESWHVTNLLNLEQTDEAERILRDLVPRLERQFGADDPRTLEAQRNVAMSHLHRNQLDEAERLLLGLRSHPALAADDRMQIRILGGLINVILRRWAEAEITGLGELVAQGEALALERVERSTRHYGPESSTTLHAEEQLADLLCRRGQFAAAAEICRRLLDRPNERLGECHSVRAAAMHTLADALTRLGQEAEAAQLQLRRLECVRRQFAVASPAVFLGALYDTLRYLDREHAADGEALARELLAALQKFGGGHDDTAFVAELYMAHFVSIQNRLDEAELMFQSLLAREENSQHARTRARLHLYYGSHLTRRDQFNQAETHLETATGLVGDIRIGTWDSHPDDIILGFIVLYEAWNKPDKLKEHQRLRDELLPPAPP